MNLLLDTAPFLWLCAGGRLLSTAATEALADQDNVVSVSAAVPWEIALKHAKGKLKLPTPVESWIPAMIRHHRLNLFPIEAATAIASTTLPPIHRDPFDRLLIATAQAHRLTLITPDQLIARYPNLRTLW